MFQRSDEARLIAAIVSSAVAVIVSVAIFLMTLRDAVA